MTRPHYPHFPTQTRVHRCKHAQPLLLVLVCLNLPPNAQQGRRPISLPYEPFNALREKVPGETLIRTVNGLIGRSNVLHSSPQQEQQEEQQQGIPSTEAPSTTNVVPAPSTTATPRIHIPTLANMDSQSLPSPAPSDDPDPKSPRQFLPDTIADPARAETALTLFRQGRPSSSNLANSHVGTMASLPIQMPVPPHVPDPVSSPHPNTSTFSHSNAIPSPKSNAFARSGSNTVPPRDQNATPNQNMPPLRIPNNPPLQTWAGRPFQQPNVASQAHGHPGSPRVPYSLDILSPTLCLPIIDNFAAHYGAQFNRADTIRLNLLREAIVNSDFFYLVLVSKRFSDVIKFDTNNPSRALCLADASLVSHFKPQVNSFRGMVSIL